jgi:hypothetical protein
MTNILIFFLFVSGVPIIEGDTVRLPKWIGLSHSLVLIMTVRLAGAKKHLKCDYQIELLLQEHVGIFAMQ